MQTAWRERNPEARIRVAKEAIDKNSECATAYLRNGHSLFISITSSALELHADGLPCHNKLYAQIYSMLMFLCREARV